MSIINAAVCAARDERPPECVLEYDLYVEVPVREVKLTHHLQSTGWVFICDGGELRGDQQIVDDSGVTRWFGLNSNML